MSEPTTHVAADRRRWWGLAVLCLSLVVVTIDTTILNVALPRLTEDLQATSSQLQWIVDGYTVVFAGLLLTCGALGDRRGRKGTLSAGLILFAAASAASALATTPEALIALRALTGVGAALIFPATLSILTNLFPDAVERQRAIAIWAGTAGIGIGLGPVAGGLLLRHFAWGSVFWVNVPVCLLALVAGAFLLPRSRDPETHPLDVPGALLSIVGLSSLVFAVIQGPTSGWTSSLVLGAFAVAAMAIASFVWVELHRAHPMLDIRLFRNPRFTAATLSVATLYFCLFGTIFFQTQFLQVVLGYDPLQAGIRSLPFAVVLLVVANTTPRLVKRFGTRSVITTGLLLVSVAMVERVVFTTTSGYGEVLVSQVVFALGMGLTIAPATASIMGAVPAGRAGVGSAMNDTTRQVGGALGVAVMGSIGASIYHHDLTSNLSGRGVPATATAKALDSLGGAAEAARALPAGSGRALNAAATSSFVRGFDAAHGVGLVVALLGAALAYRFLPAGMKVGGAEPPAESVVDLVDGDLVPVPAAAGAEVDL